MTLANTKLSYRKITMFPLRFRTLTEEPQQVGLEFFYGSFDKQLQQVGYLQWDEHTWEVELKGCNKAGRRRFFRKIPKNPDRVWEISWNKRAFNVKCNGRKVWKYRYSNRRDRFLEDGCGPVYSESLGPLATVKFRDGMNVESEKSIVKLTLPVEFYTRTKLYSSNKETSHNHMKIIPKAEDNESKIGSEKTKDRAKKVPNTDSRDNSEEKIIPKATVKETKPKDIDEQLMGIKKDTKQVKINDNSKKPPPDPKAEKFPDWLKMF